MSMRIPRGEPGPQRGEPPRSSGPRDVHFIHPTGKVVPPMNEWIIVAIVALVVIFGASKLPEIARAVGRSSGEFKKGLKEGDLDESSKTPDKPASPGTE